MTLLAIMNMSVMVMGLDNALGIYRRKITTVVIFKECCDMIYIIQSVLDTLYLSNNNMDNNLLEKKTLKLERTFAVT